MAKLRFVHAAETLHSATFDALLVAGDVYDGAGRSLRAQLKFVEGVGAVGCRRNTFASSATATTTRWDGWEARLDLPGGCFRFGGGVEGVPVFPGEPQRPTKLDQNQKPL